MNIENINFLFTPYYFSNIFFFFFFLVLLDLLGFDLGLGIFGLRVLERKDFCSRFWGLFQKWILGFSCVLLWLRWVWSDGGYGSCGVWQWWLKILLIFPGLWLWWLVVCGFLWFDGFGTSFMDDSRWFAMWMVMGLGVLLGL